MMKLKKVVPEYTGGGIYVITGSIDDDNHFIADTSNFDISIVNADPTKMPLDNITMEWIEEHLIEFVTLTFDRMDFFNAILNHLDKKPGLADNYDYEELEAIVKKGFALF